jgi:hypothetical protein
VWRNGDPLLKINPKALTVLFLNTVCLALLNFLAEKKK